MSNYYHKKAYDLGVTFMRTMKGETAIKKGEKK